MRGKIPDTAATKRGRLLEDKVRETNWDQVRELDRDIEEIQVMKLFYCGTDEAVDEKLWTTSWFEAETPLGGLGRGGGATKAYGRTSAPPLAVRLLSALKTFSACETRTRPDANRLHYGYFRSFFLKFSFRNAKYCAISLMVH
ncbi:hypothetical protein EVAR_39249_1 [Eumeta japonica]|uniref:Uncharacterized protein n=1 Tax=Eumeta variegata TaxID=151549 RepID=A0A4C1XZJ5_EUMVA|nr:hypothetical protein EVAR_39249_1 [Eumeta japonica]